MKKMQKWSHPPDPKICSRLFRKKKQKWGSIINHPKSNSADIKSTHSSSALQVYPTSCRCPSASRQVIAQTNGHPCSILSRSKQAASFVALYVVYSSTFCQSAAKDADGTWIGVVLWETFLSVETGCRRGKSACRWSLALWWVWER